MRPLHILPIVISFLGLELGLSHLVSASTLDLTQTPREISGADSDSGVAFQAFLLPTNDHVVIDAAIGTRVVHADIDYARRSLKVVSLSRDTGAPAALSVQDIVAFKKLLVSLPPKIDTGSVHGDALSSLINLIASAPVGIPIDISSIGEPFTSICPSIGRPDIAVYNINGPVFTPVVVGPVCYVPPALGRCGRANGPDPIIGLVQRFTQQCLDHDQCCAATGSRIFGPFDVCGAPNTTQCVPEFIAAASGFFFAPDCGTTAGRWTDNYGYAYVLKGGDSSGNAIAFSGTVDTDAISPRCGTWNVSGTRTGTQIVFTATNPSGATTYCVASYTYVGMYSNCNVASGAWVNSAGFTGAWSWSRANTVNSMSLIAGADTAHKPTINR